MEVRPAAFNLCVAASSCVTLGVWLNFSESHFRDPKMGVIYPEMLSTLKGVEEWMRESFCPSRIPGLAEGLGGGVPLPSPFPPLPLPLPSRPPWSLCIVLPEHFAGWKRLGLLYACMKVLNLG